MAAALYVPSLTLPLAFDDAWGAQLASLVGANGPVLLHALCITAHALNVALSYFVARAFLGDSRHANFTALAAAALFACNPLNTQAVALSTGLNHLIALLFLQLAVLSYVRSRNSPRRGERGLWIGITGALAALFAVIYALIPNGASSAFVLTLDGVIQRTLIAAQSLAHPLVWLIAPLELSGAAAVIVSLAVMSLAMMYAGRVTRVAIVGGLVWFMLAVALPILWLPTGYVENAPRVFYVASLGAAFVWAGIAVWIGDALSTRFAQLPTLALHVMCVVLITAPGAIYSLDTQRFYAGASESVRAIITHGAQLLPNEILLVLNAPEWMAVSQRRFPLFVEDMTLLAEGVSGRDLILNNAAVDRQVTFQRFLLPDQPELRYHFQTFGQDVTPAPATSAITTAARVLNTTYTADGPRTEWLGGTSAVQPDLIEATFGGHIALVQHDIAPCRTGWVVALRWRKIPKPPAPPFPPLGVGGGDEGEPRTLSAFVQVLDAQGVLIGQKDGALIGGLLAFADLPTAADVLDRRVLTATTSTQPSALHIGLYDFTNGQRLAAADARGNPLEGNALSVSLPPQHANTTCP